MYLIWSLVFAYISQLNYSPSTKTMEKTVHGFQLIFKNLRFNCSIFCGKMHITILKTVQSCLKSRKKGLSSAEILDEMIFRVSKESDSHTKTRWICNLNQPHPISTIFVQLFTIFLKFLLHLGTTFVFKYLLSYNGTILQTLMSSFIQ